MPPVARSLWVRRLVLFALVSFGYVVGYQLAANWFSAEDQGASFFPAAGVTLGALVLLRRSEWPVVLTAAFASELVLDVTRGTDVLPSLGYALANTAEPLVGALLLTTLIARVDLTRTRDLGAFIGSGVFVGPIVGALIAATTWVSIGGGSGWARFAFEWWCGDGLGVLVVGGALISLRSRPRLPLRRWLEGAGIALVAVAATVTVFEVGWFEFVYVPVALLVVLAFRLGTTWVAITGMFVAFVAAGLAAESKDFWASVAITPANRVLYMQLALGILIGAVLALAAEISARERMAVELAWTEAEREAALERARLFDAERVARERADAQARTLELLYAAAGRLSAATTEREVAEVLVEQAVESFGANAGGIALLREPTRELELLTARGYPQEMTTAFPRVPLDSAAAARDVITTGEPIWIESHEDYAARYPTWADTYRQFGLEAHALIPLPADGHPIGIFSLSFPSPHVFDKSETETLLALARQASLAFQRAASFEQEQEARRRAELLERHVAELAVAAQEIEVAEATLAGLDEIGVEAAWVQLLRDEELEIVAQRGVPPENLRRYSRYRLEAVSTPPAEAIRARAPVHVSTSAELAARFPDAVEGGGRLGTESFFSVPLQTSDGEVLGALSVISRVPNWLDEGLRALIVALAEQGGLAFERAKLRALADAAVADTNLLAQLGEVLVRPTRSHARARELVDVLTAERTELAVVHLLDEAGRPVVLEQAPAELPRGVDEATLSELAVEAVETLDVASAKVGELQLCALPLRARDETLGVLTVGFLEEQAGVTPDLFRRIAIRAALALDNALLYERERAVSHSLQMGLLGGEPEVPPEVTIATAYRPGTAALEVGGDWYDAFPLPDGRLAILVGDVVGHGLEAAVAMGQLRGAVRALAPMGPPCEVLERLDDLVATLPEAGMATIAYAELDPTDGSVTYACAGHPPPLLVSADGEARLLWDGRSAPLGSSFTRGREQAETQLDPSDTLVLYTDGLVERRTVGISERLDRLVELAREAGDVSPGELVDGILEGLLEGEDQEDDVCILVVRRAEVPLQFSHSFPASPADVARTRRAFAEWLEQVDMDAGARRDAVLAVAEAAANAAEHAYGFDGNGVVRVDGWLEDDDLLVAVRDEGTWRDPRPETDRGRGRTMMEALMRDVTIESSGAGTVVRMRLPTRKEVSA